MAFFGFGQQDPYAEAEQAAQDRQTAFAGMKDNLPALGLIAGLSMLARNNGTRSVGQLIGQAGGDALNAYGTWQKIQEAKQRQEMLDKERADEREYQRGQDAWRNDMAEKKFAMDAANMAFNQNMARQRLGIAAAAHELQRQNALKGNWALAENGMLINKDTGEMRMPTLDGQPLQLGAGGMGIGMPKLTDSAKKEVANLMAMRGALDNVRKRFDEAGGKFNGVYNGRFPNMLRSSKDAYDAQRLESSVTKMNSEFRKDTSGQALSEQELKNIKPWLPEMTDPDEVFLGKFDSLDEEWMRRAQSVAKTYNIPLEMLLPPSYGGPQQGTWPGAPAAQAKQRKPLNSFLGGGK